MYIFLASNYMYLYACVLCVYMSAGACVIDSCKLLDVSAKNRLGLLHEQNVPIITAPSV